MTYHFVAKNIGVDSGTILLADKDFYGEDYKLTNKIYQKVFKVEPGNYKVQWKIKTLFDGHINGVGNINITSGKLVVSDPGYIITEDDKWDELLKTTNYFEKEPVGTVILNKMGGDGIYNVDMILEMIS
jgi:hypothetical protein